MENCKNCLHYKDWTPLCDLCGLTSRIIDFPLFRGGSKRCECYEYFKPKKCGFKYPSKELLDNKIKEIQDNEEI